MKKFHNRTDANVFVTQACRSKTLWPLSLVLEYCARVILRTHERDLTHTFLLAFPKIHYDYFFCP